MLINLGRIYGKYDFLWIKLAPGFTWRRAYGKNPLMLLSLSDVLLENEHTYLLISNLVHEKNLVINCPS